MTPSDVKTVVANLDDFIELPDGIDRLRKAVLTLAVSGKLVPQDPKEGTADDLLKQLTPQEVSGGKKRKAKTLEPIKADEVPFPIPSSWRWVRLGEIVDFKIGKTPPRKEPEHWENGTIPWVSIADLKDQGRVSSTKEKINEDAKRSVFKGYCAPKGTLLFSFKLTIGKMSILDVDACHNEAIAAFFTQHDTLRDFLFTCLPVLNLTGRTANAIKGRTLNGDTLPLIEVPLPPLKEQERILRKVGQIMKQLDELEARKTERDAVRARLTQSAMRALGNGEKELVLDLLPELVKTRADVAELDKAILTLAVSGKLVPQDPKEGTADDLLKQAKLQEVSGGKKRKAKALEPINADEVPFPIPSSWKWIRFGSVFSDYGSGSTPNRSRSEYYGGNMNWYKSGELNDGTLAQDAEEKVTDEALEDCRLRVNTNGDLLVAMYGATAGKIAILENEGVTNQAVWGGTPNPSVDVRYLYYYLLQSRSSLIAQGAGAAQPNISGEKIIAHPLPFPPLGEQRRIVEKISAFSSLVSSLRKAVLS